MIIRELFIFLQGLWANLYPTLFEGQFIRWTSFIRQQSFFPTAQPVARPLSSATVKMDLH